MNAPATLSDFTNPRLVVPQLRNLDFALVIQELSQLMEQEKRVPDLLSFYEAVLKRELLTNTDMESDMAFPHARLRGLKDLSFALGRSNQPLRWNLGSSRPVRLVFLMAVPENDSFQYLALISGLARLAKTPALLAELHAASDAVQILDVLQQVQLRNGSRPRPIAR
jgi:PTS system fructose-specific IIC component